jgi:hypothetical protein
MHRTRTTRISATAAAAVTLLAVTAAPALADGGRGHSILRAQLVGSMPAPASPTIAGILPGGRPWVNGPSTVRVREDGRITVKIRGLVIPPPSGTGVNPVASVVATLVCDGAVRSSTAAFALSPAGDGSTSTTISGTEDCMDPMVLIQPAANRSAYIASSTGDHDDD